MSALISAITHTLQTTQQQPFSVYSSVKTQHLLNVPIIKPLLIVVLRGQKELHSSQNGFEIDQTIVCRSGEFIFLADSPVINMRNIPTRLPQSQSDHNDEYFALLIEFDFNDFNGLQNNEAQKQPYCLAKMNRELERCLIQFVESAQWAPTQLWSSRKRELIQMLCHLGHSDILTLIGKSKTSHRLHDLLQQHPSQSISIDFICSELAMSESTLRRKLKAEGSSVQEIKDHSKLGLGLHLLQSNIGRLINLVFLQ